MLSNNNLADVIPDSLGNCSVLRLLDLSKNQLTGAIPSSFRNLVSAETIFLASNNLSGDFVLDMSKLTNLESVSLSNNLMAGDVFASLATLNATNNFTAVDFTSNELTGTLPATFDVKRLTSLKVMLFGSNNLHGSIPSWVWTLPKLQLLDLKNNSFSGQLSAYFDNLRGFIDESSNNLNISSDGSSSSYIPSVTIEVAGAHVTYSTTLDWVISMQLSRNNLSGVIPTDITKLVKMKSLDLSRNQFEGEIPTNMGALTQLQFLDLSNNRLNGSIPQSFIKISNLATLFLANNSLSGAIPSGGTLQSFSNSSWLPGNKGLCGPPLDPIQYACYAAQSDSGDLSFTDLFAVPGLVVGFVVGFASIAFLCVAWKPARNFVHPNVKKPQSMWTPKSH